MFIYLLMLFMLELFRKTTIIKGNIIIYNINFIEKEHSMAKFFLMKKYFLVGILLMLGGLFYGFSCDKHHDILDVVVTEDQSIVDDYFTGHVVTGHWPGEEIDPGYKGAAYLTVGDINGNGINEIICTSGIGESYNQNLKDGSVAIFTWDGNNIDSWQQHVIYGELGWPNETVIKDVDGDGLNDIIVTDGKLAQKFPSGIFYLKNLRDDISQPDNWELKILYQYDGQDWDELTAGYHRVLFTDINGNGLEDFVTSKIIFSKWKEYENWAWVEWFENNGDGTFTGPHEIGEGGGFMFNLTDVNGDGHLDVVVPQFLIFKYGTDDQRSLEIFGSATDRNPWADSVIWFKNPGPGADTDKPWERFVIDNPFTSKNPTGRNFDVVPADLNNDGKLELVVATHNHQDFFPPDSDTRIWPSGIFLFNIPNAPYKEENWISIPMDTGDPELDLRELSPLSQEYEEAVDADTYAVDRSGGPLTQGSPGHVRLADVFGNGLTDIVVVGDGKGVVYLYKNDGMEGSTLHLRRAILHYDRGCMPAEARIADIDNNGKMDIVISVYDSGNRKYRQQSGSIFIFKQK